MPYFSDLDKITQELFRSKLKADRGYPEKHLIYNESFYTYDEWCEYIRDNFIANSCDYYNMDEITRYYPPKMRLRSSPYKDDVVEVDEYINRETIKYNIPIDWELLFNDKLQDNSLQTIIIEGTEYYYYD